MERARIRVAGVVIAALTLSACGGGGGGGTVPGGAAITTTPFTSWKDNVAGKNILLNGIGKQVSYTYACDSSLNCSGGSITSISNLSDTKPNALFMFDANSQLYTMYPMYTTGDLAVGFGGAEITGLNNLFLRGVRSDGTSRAIVSDPEGGKWNYQSFGVWETGIGSATRNFGVVSAGNTDGTKVPNNISAATFRGDVTGAYVNPAGQGHAVLATVNVEANFQQGTLTLSTSDTRISDDWVKFTSYTNLNIAESALTYNASTNTFTGNLTTVGSGGAGSLTGNTTGQYYGPNAEELGGVFFLQGSGVETYSGAYGATR